MIRYRVIAGVFALHGLGAGVAHAEAPPANASTVPAEDPAPKPIPPSGRDVSAPVGPYHGVAYGRQEGKRPIDRKGRKAAAPKVTWVGVEHFDGKSRVFVECDRATTIRVSPMGEREIVVEVPEAVIAHRNSLRGIDVSGFDSPVERIDVRGERTRVATGVFVRILLRGPHTYDTQRTDSAVAIDITASMRYAPHE